MHRLELCEGKYVFYTSSSGILYCNRHGNAWRDFIGDKAVSALFDKCIELQQAAQKAASPVSALAIRLVVADHVVYDGTADQAFLAASFGEDGYYRLEKANVKLEFLDVSRK